MNEIFKFMIKIKKIMNETFNLVELENGLCKISHAGGQTILVVSNRITSESVAI